MSVTTKKKKTKKKTVELFLDGDLLSYLKTVAGLASTDVNTVINVMLVIEMMKKRKDQND